MNGIGGLSGAGRCLAELKETEDGAFALDVGDMDLVDILNSGRIKLNVFVINKNNLKNLKIINK